ncbi:MAG: transcriptional regulator [Leptolyngbyaceae cyanobacterium MO_188.B28]|nr:transcriptional regulator [Leptolyngbyaceae cyanobacterium MO_188.B28]
MGSKAKEKSTRTRRAIINLLKQEGAMDASVLATQLHVSAMAIRQHLYALQAEKLVTYTEEPRPMGRPAKLWQLTAAANDLFPAGYAELTVGLLSAMTEAFGDEGLDRLLAVRTRQQIAAYQSQVSGQESLSAQVQALADLRTKEGYMAEIQPLGENSFLLIENHCPICAAASACAGLCQSELEVFQSVLDKAKVVGRTEHIIAGERRCVYQISG